MRGETLEVKRPLGDEVDPFGNPIHEWESELVDNILADPYVNLAKAKEFDADRPEGSRISVRFHFPKTYIDSLKGCFICWRGREYRVLGDPVGLPEYLTPGDWNRPVDTEACDG